MKLQKLLEEKKIKVMRLRDKDRNPIVTIIFNHETKNVGLSVVNPRDRFDKGLGNHIAYQRSLGLKESLFITTTCFKDQEYRIFGKFGPEFTKEKLMSFLDGFKPKDA